LKTPALQSGAKGFQANKAFGPVIQDERHGFNEPFIGYSLTQFDGEKSSSEQTCLLRSQPPGNFIRMRPGSAGSTQVQTPIEHEKTIFY
jgi:hypothetical protein